MNANPANRLRDLPSVDVLIGSDGGAALIREYGRSAALASIRAALETVRDQLRAGVDTAIAPADLLDAAAADLHLQFRPSLRPVINATGIILHTNLGRSPLSESTCDAIAAAAANYSTLEYDLDTGGRGSRLIHAEQGLIAVTGAESGMAVNNAASALVLILSTFAQGREVIVSRGQLVEIGGGFRIPEVMTQSGAMLREVGTTNKTRISDYEHAITDHTTILMRVHASNFKLIGFTETPTIEAIASLGAARGLITVDDLGSGALLDTARYGLEHEPTVTESLTAGVDLVVFSGDKLLGAPQAGVIVGKKALIDRLKRHPLARAIRADKLCLAGLSATLDHYRRGEATEKIPIWRMIAMPLHEIERIAQNWRDAAGMGTVIASQSAVGGGSLPGETLPTACWALDVPDATAFVAKLRASDPPIIARITDNRVLFDPRTVLPGQGEIVVERVRAFIS